MADGKVVISTKLDNSGFQKGASALKGEMGNLAKSMTKLMAVAFSAKALVTFGKEAIALGSNVIEVQNVVDVAFGGMAYKIEEFAKSSIQNFGMSQLSAKKTASTYMAMARGMGISADAASDMAISLTGLTGDVSSFYNISQELADTKLKSIFTGETETLKDLGIVMTQANLQQFAYQQGIQKSINKMGQAELVALRYKYVTQQLALAQGDFARTSSSWANQTRILSEQWNQFKNTIGQSLITIFTPLLKTLNSITAALVNVANMINTVVSSVFGVENRQLKQSQSYANGVEAAISGSVEGQEALTDATKESGKAAKGALAGFDELNVLAKESGAGGSAGGSVSIPELDNSASKQPDKKDLQLDPAIEQAISKLQSLLEPLQKISFDSLKKSFEGLLESIKPFVRTLFSGLEWAYFNLLLPLSVFSIEQVLPRFFDTLAIAVKGADVVISGAIDTFKTLYNTFLKPAAEYTGTKFLKFLDQTNVDLQKLTDTIEQSTAFQDLQSILQIIGPIVLDIWKNLVDFASIDLKFLWDVSLIDLNTKFKNLEDAIGLVADVLNGDFSGAWEHLKNLLLDNWVDDFKAKMDAWKTKFTEVKGKITELATEWSTKLKAVIEEWKAKISEWWEQDVKPWFTLEKWESLFSSMGEEFGKAVGSFIDFWNIKMPEWWNQNVAPWFTLEKWDALFSSIWQSIVTTVETYKEKWGAAISDWWENDVKPWFTLEKWEEIGQGIIDGLVQAVTNAINAVKHLWDSFWSGFTKGKAEVEGTVSVEDKSGGRSSRIGVPQYPQIPKLASGGVIPPNAAFLAVLGDQKRGTNIEAPLDTIKQGFREALAEGGYSRAGGDVYLQIDGKTFARITDPYFNAEKGRKGVKIVKGVVR